MKIRDVIYSANTGLDAIKRAPVLEYPTDLRCIRIQDISQGKPFLEWAYTKTTTNDYKKFKLCKNDVLVARTGATVGVSYLVKEDIESVFNNGSIRLRVNENVNAKFLYYLINTNEFLTFIDNVSCVATQPNLRIENLLRFDFPDYSVEKQTEIANVLSTYDDLIENNNKRIKLLEQMAENLYKEWFVRFRFPNHENTEFENGIPKGWEYVKLGEYANISTGKCNREDAEEDGIYPLFDRSQEIKKSSVWLKDCEAIIVPGEGTSFIPRYYKGKFNLHQRCYCVEPKISKTGKFIFYTLMLNRIYFLYVATGATVPSLRQNNFTNMKIIMPKMELVNKYDDIVSSFIDEINSLKERNENLINQRDLLLPRLMSGKLEV